MFCTLGDGALNTIEELASSPYPNAPVAFSALTLLVGRQEGYPAHKKIWGDGGGGHWLVRMEWCPARWSVCLPLLISPCTIKSRSSLLAPAHPGGLRKKAAKQLCVRVTLLQQSAFCQRLSKLFCKFFTFCSSLVFFDTFAQYQTFKKKTSFNTMQGFRRTSVRWKNLTTLARCLCLMPTMIHNNVLLTSLCTSLN